MTNFSCGWWPAAPPPVQRSGPAWARTFVGRSSCCPSSSTRTLLTTSQRSSPTPRAGLVRRERPTGKGDRPRGAPVVPAVGERPGDRLHHPDAGPPRSGHPLQQAPTLLEILVTAQSDREGEK